MSFRSPLFWLYARIAAHDATRRAQQGPRAAAGRGDDARTTHADAHAHAHADADARRCELAERLRQARVPLILALAQIDEVDPVRGHMLWTMMSDVDLGRGIVPRVTDPDLRRLVANLPAYYTRRFERAGDDPEVLALAVLADAVA